MNTNLQKYIFHYNICRFVIHEPYWLPRKRASANAGGEAFLGGVPGVRDVGETVPGHRQELHKHHHQGQHLVAQLTERHGLLE